MTTALTNLTSQFAERFGLQANSAELIQTLKDTAFRGSQVNDSQMTTLILVAEQYKLNPWLKEIYAFPDKGGIVPVVGVDGWSRIMNEHPQFDGMDFEQDDEKCTCTIYRKDRSHPIRATEYMTECRRDNAQPWKSHPKRMLRHKAMIQCARLAFGFGGIYDQDEAERIIEAKDAEFKVAHTKQKEKEVVMYSREDFEKNKAKWEASIKEGKATPEKIIAMVETKGVLTNEMIEEIKSFGKVAE